MKLILVEYLASLRERDELDVILPDLLSENGMLVISKPAIGTKQYGVDVIAVSNSKRKRKVYLISIKPGDLRRSGWNTGKQSLRASLDEIQEVYIEKFLPRRYKCLPVVVVLCLGGELHEDVRTEVEAYIDKHTGDGIEFEVWNGDILASKILSGVLREKVLPRTWHSDFRKSLALLDEPTASLSHFNRLANSIHDACKTDAPSVLTAVRQIYVGLWTNYAWGRQADNIEAAYLCSERAVLVAWELIKRHLAGNSRAVRQIRLIMNRLIDLHVKIAVEYITIYVEPRAGTLHGLSSAVPSHAHLDVNLRLFDIVGRVGMTGLWLQYLTQRTRKDGEEHEGQGDFPSTQRLATVLSDIIKSNPILLTPIKDSQAIDINIACLFLSRNGSSAVITHWIREIARATIFAFQSHCYYPCIYDDYWDLASHPREGSAYRAEATAGSLLVPTLGVWAAITKDVSTLGTLADFSAGSYAHSTLQLLYPGSDTETHLYCGGAIHGLAAEIKIHRSCEAMLAPIKLECEATDAFTSLSAISYGYCPLVVLASRHHRVPVPPQFWSL